VGRRILAYAAAFVVLLVAVVLIGLLVFTNTDFGREKVRGIAQSAIQGAAKHGVVRLGRVSGNLLEGFTISNLSIRDSSNAPFLVADTVSLNYGLRALLLKRLEISDVRLVRPLVVLDRPPGDSPM
jgi:autotransporter translocation and assembly factor TamB